ncbi:hypothetical protein ScPMuIL_008774 [Solemya velum]
MNNSCSSISLLAWTPGADEPTEEHSLEELADDVSDGEEEEKTQKIKDFKKIKWYENAADPNLDSIVAPPPAVYVDPVPLISPEYSDMAHLSEESCRDAIISFAQSMTCYGTGAAKEMYIQGTIGLTSFHYVLETFTETRSTGYVYTPYRGGPVDGPENGEPPKPWAILCGPDCNFENQTKLIEVPHTSYLTTCFNCEGRGWNTCGRCYGRGRVRCRSCHGNGRRAVFRDGHRHHETCHFCSGRGNRSFPECIFLSIIVFPKCLRHIWCLLTSQVSPMTDFSVPEINQHSVQLVNDHNKSWPMSRKLQQRQQLRAVPVTECAYRWKDHNTRFWIYGDNKRVHAPDYPQQCCWGCQIL